MRWEHSCSLEWMQKRQDYVTASDIKDLIPYTTTGNKRKITIDSYMKVLARKIKQLSKDDCVSYGAAARGHILEPYAVSEANKVFSDVFHHWDDLLIPNDELGLAFSPDATDVSMDEYEKVGLLPSKILEIKCYGSEKHLSTAMRSKDFIEERWQIATAMACVNEIEDAWLVLFDPSLTIDRLAMIHWDRNELKREIEIIIETTKKWYHWLMEFKIAEQVVFEDIETIGESTIIDCENTKNILNP